VDALYALNRPEMLQGVSSAGIDSLDASFTGGVSSVGSGAAARPALTASQSAQSLDPTRTGIWLTTNMVIQVVDLPDQPEYEDAERQDKLPMTRLQSGLINLQKMMPLIADNIGTSSDYWAKRDEEEDSVSELGYQATYDAYYSAENAIVVVKREDDSLHVRSGGERVWLAKKLGVKELPILLMQQPPYAQPRNFQDAEENDWQMWVFDEENSFQIRIFNISKRAKLPEKVTDGDGICIDVVIQDNGDTAHMTRFDLEEKHFDQESGFGHEAITYVEEISLFRGAKTLYLKQDTENMVSSPHLRDWYQSAGFSFNREGNQTVIYKTLKNN
ncbi:MAG: hypothetical protein K8L99_03340, partial [Anaerolineae bacterium]|nr:hypothetical protein [Anaerolineae bacterium]